MDKPANPQYPSAEYQMHPVGAQPGMTPQHSGYGPSPDNPPQYGPVQGDMPPQQQGHVPVGGPPMQSPPMQSPPPQQHQGQQPPVQPYQNTDGTYGVPLTTLGSTSAPVTCPNCGHRGMTNVEYEAGGFTHLVALAVCCFICLGCLAYLANSLKDCHHRCSKCGVPLATYHRSGRTELHFRPQ